MSGQLPAGLTLPRSSTLVYEALKSLERSEKLKSARAVRQILKADYHEIVPNHMYRGQHHRSNIRKFHDILEYCNVQLVEATATTAKMTKKHYPLWCSICRLEKAKWCLEVAYRERLRKPGKPKYVLLGDFQTAWLYLYDQRDYMLCEHKEGGWTLAEVKEVVSLGEELSDDEEETDRGLGGESETDDGS